MRHLTSRRILTVAFAALAAGAILLPKLLRAEDPPPPGEKPRGDLDQGPIVAVIDTGVDARHPALEGRCLPGVNMADPTEPGDDADGHGTAIAGLIASADAAPEYKGTCPSARILPIKVTPAGSRETLPSFLAMGIEKAIEKGAHVICIAMGASRSSEALDNAIERAKKAGVVIVAAAGVGDGAADLWPAMHPWVVSCTVSESGLTKLPGQKVESMVEYPAARAHYSGKTELIGKGSAPVLAPGGGHSTLEGSSVPCAQAAGLAARLWQKYPKAGAAEIRRLLVLSGAALEAQNIWYHYPARRFGAGIVDALPAAPADGTDLALTYVDVNPGPLEPDKAGKLEFSVTNIGFAPAGGEVSFEDTEDSITVKGTFEAVPPGETRVVTVDLPALKEHSYNGFARLASKGDKNAANDVLNLRLNVMKWDKPAVTMYRPRFTRLRMNDRKAVVEFEVQNARDVELACDAVAEAGDVDATVPMKFTGRGTKTASIEIELPALNEQERAFRFLVAIMQGEKGIQSADFRLMYDEKPGRVQYADAWATKEVIIDAPAFLLEGRESIPFLLFAPEVNTAALDADKQPRGKVPQTTPARGLWLYDFTLEEVSEELARTTAFDWRQPPPPTMGGKVLLHVEGDAQKPVFLPERTKKAHEGIFAESAVGFPVGLETLIQFVEDDGWNSVVNIPIVAFEHKAEPHVYVRGAARYLDKARNPWVGAWSGFESDSVPYQTMLRVRLHAALPKLENSGQYYDIHVHTQCEFSRDAAEPRLAFGGPLWMLIRSAHAMGLIDTAYLEAVKHGDLKAVAENEVLFTTDHNCFLAGGDKPTALPFKSGEDEITTLRRFFGKGANQEVGMAAPGGRPLGSPHALTYGAPPRPGPWHGGRNFQSGILKAGKVLDVLENVDKKDLAEKSAAFLLKACKEKPLLQGAFLAMINEQLKKAGVAPLSADAFKAICDAWGGLSAQELKETVDLADRVLSAAAIRGEANDNTVKQMESDLAKSGTFIAAHPMLKPLDWDLDDLDRAANVAGGPFPEVEVAQRFPFAGIQSWNEEPLYKAPLADPDMLRAYNPWYSGGFKPNGEWHAEWALGFLHYENRLAKPGMMFTFDGKETRRRYFIRKLYHYAGSDAHGAFNFTTGVGATILTKREVMPIAAAFGYGHGTETSSSHFACARVYARKPAFEEVYRGRVVCTDGPLAWFDVDADVRFDGKALVWHESWEAPSLAQDVDGEIGGDGAFDGRRTALVRRDGDGMVVRYRVADGGPLAPAAQRLDLFRLSLSDEAAPKEMERVGNLYVPRPQASWRPAKGQDLQYRALKPWAPGGPALLMLGGFSRWDEDVDDRYDVKTKRFLTNPIWITTVQIGASATPVVQDGKAFIPKGAFVATFRADHSMRDEAPTVFAKQLNAMGDSVAATYKLVPVANEEGFWKPDPREIGGAKIEVDDAVLVAVNDQPIPLGVPWYPTEGIDTFAVILAGAKDTHGNPFNAVAWKIEVGVPAGTVVTPDPTNPGDPGGETPKASSPSEATTCSVRSGEEVQLPKGATCDGKKIPPGAWTVPEEIPPAGLSLVVSCSTGTLTLLLTKTATPAPPVLTRNANGFTGRVPSNGTRPPSVLVKNHAEKTAVPGDPLLVTPDTCIFDAPGLAPGPCTVSVTQADAAKTYDVEAVSAKLVWDLPDAAVGDVRALSLLLDGAARPGDWLVSGTFSLQGGDVVSTNARVQRLPDGSFRVLDLPGDAGVLLRVKAVVQGKMTVVSHLDAGKKPAK